MTLVRYLCDRCGAVIDPDDVADHISAHLGVAPKFAAILGWDL